MNTEKSLKMKNMPVGRLIASMSIPAMFSMLIQALYNIVDSIYVSQLDKTSDNMITALGYAFSMQIIIMAFAFGIGVGTTVLISRKLGERNNQEASDLARTGIVLAIIMGLIFFVLSFFIVRPFLNFMSDIAAIIDYGTQYLTIIMMFSLGMYVEIVNNKILQGMGRMLFPMFVQLIGAITNIILDPILIFGYLGLPALGIQGAAYATVISQWLAMLVSIGFIVFNKFEINLSLRKFHFKLSNVVHIIVVGTPVFIMNSIAAVTNIVLNNILKIFDPEEIANAVLAVYLKLQSFIFMPIFGLNQGGMPILSYNYGANDKKRFYKAAKILILTPIILMLLGLFVFQVFPSQLINFFNPTEKMLVIGTRALRIFSLGFIPASVVIIYSMMFQSFGKGKYASIMSLLRQVILLIPFVYVLGLIGGVDYVWFSYPLAEFIVIIVFTPILITSLRKAFALRDISFPKEKTE